MPGNVPIKALDTAVIATMASEEKDMELLPTLIWVSILSMTVSNLVCCLCWRMMGRRLWPEFFAACKKIFRRKTA
jgi:hypothetical protein